METLRSAPPRWGGGAGSRLRAPKVKMTPERNLHSQLSPTTDVKWKQLPEAVGGAQETALTRLCEDGSHFSLPTPDLLCRPNISSGSCMSMPMLGCGAGRVQIWDC